MRQAVDLTAENFEARLLLIDLETDAGNFAEVETQVEATEAIAEARGDASCFRLKLRKNAGETRFFAAFPKSAKTRKTPRFL